MLISQLAGNESSTQYRDLQFHAKGGMGEIYKAQDILNSNKPVAIKLIDVSDPDYKGLLCREIDVSKKISGPNIVKTHYTGEFTEHNRDYIYIVQDFYENGNLRKFIRQGTPLEECFNLIVEILNGLKTLHTTIVHRDIKPDNILIDENNIPLITDFGLAKYIDQKTRSRTFKGWGTLPYMAPECWLSEENSISMDIYAMGILFYELIAGRLPISFKTETEWRDFHVYEQMPDISNLRPEVPVKAKQILSKMVQKRVNDRYKSAEDVIEALAEASTIAAQEKNDLERLAALGHGSFERLQEERLRSQKENDKIAARKKHINYHISELFDRIKAIVTDVNSRMELGKLVVRENKIGNEPEQRKLIIDFNGKRVELTFPAYNYVETHEAQHIDKSRCSQREQYGFIISPIEKSDVTKRGITFVGKVEANFISPIGGEKFGFNLALVEETGNLYGKWYVASFSDIGLGRTSKPRKNFALELRDFFSEFPKAFVTHTITIDYHVLTQKDIVSMLEELLR